MTTILFALSLLTIAPTQDNEVFDTLRSSVISSGVKQVIEIDRLASPSSSFYMKEIVQRGIASPKGLSGIVPNLNLPDYGSAMTSTVYIRGFGSRIDNPVIGLYIDDIPILNKNNYDFDFLDIRKVDVLRGPQGTLYGRNSLCGVLAVNTLSPNDVQGGRVRAEYGSGNSFNGAFSFYRDKIGLTASYKHSDGFYSNTFNDEKCDKSDALSLRGRFAKMFSERINLDKTLSFSLLRQGGYPYRQLKDGDILPISYNDDCGYKRLSITDGTKVTFKGDKYTVNSISSLELLFDKMDLDQDFTQASFFTLRQIQREYALTQEVIVKPVSHPSWWNRQSGFFGFARYNDMSAPVRFKRDGIQSLILDNANANIPPAIGRLAISDNSFPINSEFGIGTFNLALYHESYFSFGRWLLTAGLRFDFEGNRMSYDSDGTLHYSLVPLMSSFREFETTYKGVQKNSYCQLLPKLSAVFDAGKGLSLFGIIAKGYKSGGFNTQIFSDILQNKMMTGIMDDLGVHVDGMTEKSLTAHNTVYKPETSLDYEFGARYSLKSKNGLRLKANASFFYITAENQQITVFPPGQSTGRMMANVGESYSCGAEAELDLKVKHLGLNASYGYTRAKFKTYNDGLNDYEGNSIPYSPEQTLSGRLSYEIVVHSGLLRRIELACDYTGTGRIWWNEANTLIQGYYGLLGGDINLYFGKFSLYLRTDNLTGDNYTTFYFKSVGNEFVQRSKPARLTAGVLFDF